MKKLQTLVVDDEKNSRDILQNYIEKYCPQLNFVGSAASIKEAIKFLNSGTIDLVFLDIEMPFGTGFDLLEQYPNRDFDVVMVTAYDQYAIDALNSHVSYYLMKPIDIDELIEAAEYVWDTQNKEEGLEDMVLKTNKILKGRITLPQQDGFEILETDKILYCKADDNYTEIYTEDTRYVVSKTLKYFEEALKDYTFVRVHKSYLINISKMKKYKKGKGGSVLMSNNKEIVVAASKKKELLSYF
ncbi:MAG: LytTR family DNA-binding domain-containing protein [Flavobacteriaceae bacterium]|nr:LytTR family DNA-binding domain-containing protein [Flavobacteriaceae bacterium]